MWLSGMCEACADEGREGEGEVRERERDGARSTSTGQRLIKKKKTERMRIRNSVPGRGWYREQKRSRRAKRGEGSRSLASSSGISELLKACPTPFLLGSAVTPWSGRGRTGRHGMPIVAALLLGRGGRMPLEKKSSSERLGWLSKMTKTKEAPVDRAFQGGRVDQQAPN